MGPVTGRSHAGSDEEMSRLYGHGGAVQRLSAGACARATAAATRSDPNPNWRNWVAETTATAGEMKRTLTLTGVTVNAMALIAPGAFLWTTFEAQAALQRHGSSTANEMWTGLFFSLILALLTAYSYAELARIYPDAGTGSSYYFAEAALLDKEKPEHQRLARFAKLSVGWVSHLYYWIYPGIMVAFTATLFDYIYSSLAHHQLTGV